MIDTHANLRAEIESLRAQLAAVTDRIITIADEAFGPFPVTTAEEAMSSIEQGVHAQRLGNEALRRELAEARARPALTAEERVTLTLARDVLDDEAMRIRGGGGDLVDYVTAQNLNTYASDIRAGHWRKP